MLALIVAVQVAAFASHPEVTLPGSNFEIDTDANLKVDDPAPSIDWASVTETRKPDKASGSGDDSFGQGTKEDTPVPTVVSGSIPPNKSDLKTFGVYLESNANGNFLNLYWNRVQDPTGTTNMDFEFNQSKTLSANGVTPVRTAGDVLIQYDLANGGTNPELFVSRWVTSGAGSQCEASNSTPCWSARTNLTDAGDATGSINTTPIPAADSDGLGAMSARTFGEAQIDFDALTGGAGSCVSFGSAYLKSRSSDSFTAALKDFIAPATLDLPKCGGITIRKVTVPSPDPTDNTFDYSTTGGLTPATFDLKNGEAQEYGAEVPAGTYSVTETDRNQDNFALTNIDCSASTTTNGSTATPVLADGKVDIDLKAGDSIDCTFTNTLQAQASSMTSTQSFIPNDSATITAPAGTGNLAGTVKFELFESSDCSGSAIYTKDNVAVSGASPKTVSTDNTTVSTTSANVSWQLTYTSTNSLQKSIPATCLEKTALTINNGGTATSP
jgi:hypothetical protein